MIGKPEWFSRRKYSGWGVVPKTREGWIYILFMLAPFLVFQMLPFWTDEFRIGVTLGWLILLVIDVFDIMINLNLDEREKKHESIAERNAAWVMVMVLVLGLLYQAIYSALNQTFVVDIFLIWTLLAGVAAKCITNIILARRN